MTEVVLKKIINYVVGITVSIFVFVLCSCDLLFGILQNAAEELFTDVPDVSNEAEALERSDFLFVTTDDNQFEIDINNDYYLLKVNASQEKGYDSNGTNRMSEIISSNKELFNNRSEELVRVRDFNQNFRIAYTEDLFRAIDVIEEPVQYKIGDSKIFYFMGQGQKNIEKTGILKAVGSKCRIWYVDNANRNLNVSSNLSRKNEFNNLQKLFDDVIFAKETNVFGSNVPATQYSNIIKVNENSFIDIVLCDILEDAEVEQENKGGVYGYFYSLDMITNEYLESYYKDKEHDISNQAEIFFVDSYFLDKSPKACYSTLAHEFQHMLNYVNKQLNNQVQSKTWFNEMLSMCCEELLQDDLGLTDEETPKGRLGYFNIAPDYGFNDYIWNALKENT